VLLIEDDATVAAVVAGLLEAHGHGAVHVPHGLAALAELTLQRFDLAFVDLDLPGVGGLELAAMIRAQGHALPLCALTARADAGAEAEAYAAGFRAFLRKPVSGEQLARAIEQVRADRDGATGSAPHS
jgi:CheY-like chemotaxis protein